MYVHQATTLSRAANGSILRGCFEQCDHILFRQSCLYSKMLPVVLHQAPACMRFLHMTNARFKHSSSQASGSILSGCLWSSTGDHEDTAGPGRFPPSFAAIVDREMQKLPLFSCILLRNEGKSVRGRPTRSCSTVGERRRHPSSELTDWGG